MCGVGTGWGWRGLCSGPALIDLLTEKAAFVAVVVVVEGVLPSRSETCCKQNITRF